MFPAYFGAIHERFSTPSRAVIVIGILAMIGTAIGGNIVNFAQLAVMAIMVIQIITGIALWRLPAKLPEVYQSSPYKLSLTSLRVISAIFITYSVGFLVVLSIEKPTALVSGTVFIIVGYLIFRLGVSPKQSPEQSQD